MTIKRKKLTQHQVNLLLKLLEASWDLNQIVEGVPSVNYNWTSMHGDRLKDSHAWVNFYVSLHNCESIQFSKSAYERLKVEKK